MAKRTDRLLESMLLLIAMLPIADASPPHPVLSSPADESAAIYTLFLDKWLGQAKGPTNLAQLAVQPSEEEVGGYVDCLKEAKLPAISKALPPLDLRETNLKMRRDIRLVDAQQWHPRDPGAAIASGTAVNRAVEQGFVGGLLTLSAIAFDEVHSTSIFTYSFVCGSLCGSGGTVIFTKSHNVWKQSNRQCGGWVS